MEKQKQQIEVANETLVKASVFWVHICFSHGMLSDIAFEMWPKACKPAMELMSGL